MDIKFSPDGSLLAVAKGSGTSLWRLADSGSLTLMRKLSVGDSTHGLSFSPDGQLLAVGSADAVRLWRLADGKLLHTFPGHGIDIAFSPDGRWLAVPESAYSNNVGLWDVGDGNKIRSLTSEVSPSHSQQVHSLAVSPDGSLLATGNMDTRVRIWRTSDGTLIDTPDLGSGNTADSITFSPDNSTLVAGSYGRVKMRTIEVRP
jgi:WD40 repeat protein